MSTSDQQRPRGANRLSTLGDLPARDEGLRPERWRAVWVGATVLVGVAVLLTAWATAGSSGGTSEDYSGWGYIGWIVTPFLAAASASIMALVADLAVDWASWRGPFTTGRLCAAAVALSWMSGLLIVAALASVSVEPDTAWGIATIALPVALGIATVLVSMRWRRRYR
jgi:cytochrome bd-type quinol oxidase subunit 2